MLWRSQTCSLTPFTFAPSLLRPTRSTAPLAPLLLRSTRSCAPLALLAPLAPLALRLREDIAAHHTHTHYLRDLEPLVQAIVGNDQQAVEQVIGTMSQLPNATLQELLANPAQLRAVVTQRPAAGVPSSGAAVALDNMDRNCFESLQQVWDFAHNLEEALKNSKNDPSSKQTITDEMKQLLRSHNKTPVDNDGSGHCVMYAVRDTMRHRGLKVPDWLDVDADDVMKCRGHVVDELERRAKDALGRNGQTMEEFVDAVHEDKGGFIGYCKTMRTTSEYFDEIMIMIMSCLVERPIRIVNPAHTEGRILVINPPSNWGIHGGSSGGSGGSGAGSGSGGGEGGEGKEQVESMEVESKFTVDTWQAREILIAQVPPEFHYLGTAPKGTAFTKECIK